MAAVDFSTLVPDDLAISRFWSKVRKDPDGCWRWTACIGTRGYGQFTFGLHSGADSKWLAHRFSWVLHNGPIPDGRCVLHHCDNRSCVNPDHLWIGTPADNTRDMLSKGRHTGPRGTRQGNHKLTDEDVLGIRRRAANGESQKSIAEDFGLVASAVSLILGRKRWAWLREPDGGND